MPVINEGGGTSATVAPKPKPKPKPKPAPAAPNWNDAPGLDWSPSSYKKGNYQSDAARQIDMWLREALAANTNSKNSVDRQYGASARELGANRSRDINGLVMSEEENRARMANVLAARGGGMGQGALANYGNLQSAHEGRLADTQGLYARQGDNLRSAHDEKINEIIQAVQLLKASRQPKIQELAGQMDDKAYGRWSSAQQLALQAAGQRYQAEANAWNARNQGQAREYDRYQQTQDRDLALQMQSENEAKAARIKGIEYMAKVSGGDTTYKPTSSDLAYLDVLGQNLGSIGWTYGIGSQGPTQHSDWSSLGKSAGNIWGGLNHGLDWFGNWVSGTPGFDSLRLQRTGNPYATGTSMYADYAARGK